MSRTHRSSSVVVVGEALLDVDVDGEVSRICPDAPAAVLDEGRRRVRPGGAALAAVFAARAVDALWDVAATDGGPEDHGIVLLTAIGDDEAGGRLRVLLGEAGVRVVDLGAAATTPQKIRLRSGQQVLLRLDRGDGPVPGSDPDLPTDATGALEAAGAVLVADYGLGLLARPRLRGRLEQLRAPVVWDPHPRSRSPVPGVALLTPNHRELNGFVRRHRRAAVPDGSGPTDLVDAARELRRDWMSEAVAVTRGEDGAILVRGDEPAVVIPAPSRVDGDPCGAGDALAATAAAALARGLLLTSAVELAVAAATDHVAHDGADHWQTLPEAAEDGLLAGPAAVKQPPESTITDAPVPDATITVAAGGCFDLLHAGHVATLRAARGLGDRLVVLLNSDESVQRLKGPDRPLQPEEDRRAVLLALDCVDEVVIFDEDTPITALETLRPRLFVKGGDYAGLPLAETAVLARWGGQVVTVPYLSGRSTTRLLQEARRGR